MASPEWLRSRRKTGMKERRKDKRGGGKEEPIKYESELNLVLGLFLRAYHCGLWLQLPEKK